MTYKLCQVRVLDPAPREDMDHDERLVEECARAAHEVNRAYCLALGDTSQPSWESAPDWQTNSAKNGVRLHLSGDHTPEESHESWLMQKLSEGWRYGPVKDPEKKTHPCCVPYSDLPTEQKVKDSLFRSVVLSTAHAWRSAQTVADTDPAPAV